MGCHGFLSGRRLVRRRRSVCVRMSPDGFVRVRIVSSGADQCRRVRGTGRHDLTLVGTRWHGAGPVGIVRTVGAVRVRRVPVGVIECRFIRARMTTLRYWWGPRQARADAVWWLLKWRCGAGFREAGRGRMLAARSPPPTSGVLLAAAASCLAIAGACVTSTQRKSSYE